MKKINTDNKKKLDLRRRTVQLLDTRHLVQVAGGLSICCSHEGWCTSGYC